MQLVFSRRRWVAIAGVTTGLLTVGAVIALSALQTPISPKFPLVTTTIHSNRTELDLVTGDCPSPPCSVRANGQLLRSYSTPTRLTLSMTPGDYALDIRGCTGYHTSLEVIVRPGYLTVVDISHIRMWELIGYLDDACPSP